MRCVFTLFSTYHKSHSVTFHITPYITYLAIVLLSLGFKERTLCMNNEQFPLIPSLRSAAASSPGFVQTHHSFRGRRAAHQPGMPLQLQTNASGLLNLMHQIEISLGSNDKYHCYYFVVKTIKAVPLTFSETFTQPSTMSF